MQTVAFLCRNTTYFLVSFTMCLTHSLCVCACVTLCLVSKHWKAVKSSWVQRWCTVLQAWTSSAQWPWPSLTVPRWTLRTGTSSSRGEPRTANGRWELQARTCQVQYSPSRSQLGSDMAFGFPCCLFPQWLNSFFFLVKCQQEWRDKTPLFPLFVVQS